GDLLPRPTRQPHVAGPHLPVVRAPWRRELRSGPRGLRRARPPRGCDDGPGRAAAAEGGDVMVTVGGKAGPAGLEVVDATVHYGSDVGIEDVTVEVRPGEVVGLLGPSGCGKSTL